MIPNTINNQLTLGKNDINLNFVNRKDQLISAWDCCAYNSSNQDRKHILLVSGQMFGSGKTVFGKQLFNFQNPYVKSIFDNNYKDSDSNKEFLKNTLPVYINLQQFNEKFDSIHDLVSYCMFVSTLSQLFQIDERIATEFWKRNKDSLRNCASLLLSIIGHTLFFHFDEVAQLPELFNLERGKDPYYAFWGAIVPVQKSGCFVYASGRSPVLNFFGTHKGAYGSPSGVSHIQLSLFKEEDIKDILWNSSNDPTKSKVTEVGDKLMIKTEEEAKKIAKWLHYFTTGVPRIVEYSLSEMIKQSQEEKHLIDWENKNTPLLDKDNIALLLPSFPQNVADIEKRNEEIALLVCYSMINFKISQSDIFPISKIFHLVDYYGFYIEAVEGEAGRFTIKYPRLWMENRVFDEIPSISKLYNLPIDKSRALEELVKNKIIFVTHHSKKTPFKLFEGFEFLTNTKIAHEYLPELEHLKMKTKATKDNRKQVFDNDTNILASENILVEPVPQSSYPDIITIFGPSIERKCYIGWQMKNYPKSILQVNQLQNELSKFTDILPDKYKAAIFVMIVNGNVDDIVKKYQGKVISDSDTDPMKELKIELTENVQFIILSVNQMNQFLGENNLRDLLEFQLESK